MFQILCRVNNCYYLFDIACKHTSKLMFKLYLLYLTNSSISAILIFAIHIFQKPIIFMDKH